MIFALSTLFAVAATLTAGFLYLVRSFYVARAAHYAGRIEADPHNPLAPAWGRMRANYWRLAVLANTSGLVAVTIAIGCLGLAIGSMKWNT